MVGAKMIPAGYMAKWVSDRPEWLKAERVSDVYSVSKCVSKDFADYVDSWKHNGFSILQRLSEKWPKKIPSI
jgi:hypothetical protein